MSAHEFQICGVCSQSETPSNLRFISVNHIIVGIACVYTPTPGQDVAAKTARHLDRIGHRVVHVTVSLSGGAGADAAVPRRVELEAGRADFRDLTGAEVCVLVRCERSAKFIVFNAKFLVFDAQFLVVVEF